ncbi:MAG: TatD family hydrolase [Bacteroidota bacterium]
MQLVDTHLHLYAEEFQEDRKQVIDAAIQNGVTKMLLPNIDSSTIHSMMQLYHDYPDNCFPMMGLHPCYVNDSYEKELKQVETELKSGKYYGVGEIGMDKYWDLTHIEEQTKALTKQLMWAYEMELPVALHTRNCTKDVIDIIQSLNIKGLKGIFHCFGGTLDEAKEIIDLGLLLGIGGVVTFKNSGLDEIIREVDLKHLVLETDGPYLAPAPFRGKRNQPAYLIHIAEKIADIKQCGLNEVANVTTANALTLFEL